MRIKTIILIQLLLLTCVVHAQSVFFTDSISTSQRFMLGISAGFTAKSNSFPNNFYTQFYQGGYLTDAVKKEGLKDLKSSNRFGADVDAGIYFKQRLDTVCKQTGWSYTIRLAERRHLSLKMSDDFFNVGFFGNAMYENKTAHLGDFNLNFISYQQAGIGLEKVIKRKEQIHQIGFTGNFINGRNAQQASIDRAELYTATDGEYLDLDFKGNYNKTDSLKNNQIIPNISKGKGFSFDFYYQLETKSKNKLQISISDFGYIYWKNPSIAYNYDTLVHFEGITIPSLISINDSLIKMSTDSIKNSFEKSENKSFKTVLPAWFQVHYTHYLIPQKLAITCGAKYRFNDVYIPFVYLGTSYNFTAKSNATFSVGYGGYGQFNYSLFLNQKIGKQFYIGIGSNQIEGLVLPKKANGQSVQVALKTWF